MTEENTLKAMSRILISEAVFSELSKLNSFVSFSRKQHTDTLVSLLQGLQQSMDVQFDELESAQRFVKDQNSEIAKLRNEMERLTVGTRKLTVVLEKAKHRIVQLNHSLSEHAERYSSLSADYDALLISFESVSQKLTDSISEGQVFLFERDSVMGELQRVQEQLFETQAHNKALEDQVEHQNKQYDTARSEISELVSWKATAEETKKTLDIKLEQTESSVLNAEKELAELHIELERTGEELSSARAEVESLNDRQDMLASELEASKASRAALEEELVETGEKINNLERHSQDQDVTLRKTKAELETLKSDLEIAENRISKERDRNSKLREKYHDAENSLSEEVSQRNKLKEQLDEFCDFIDAGRDEIARNESKILDLEQEINNHKNKISSLSEQLELSLKAGTALSEMLQFKPEIKPMGLLGSWFGVGQ